MRKYLWVAFAAIAVVGTAQTAAPHTYFVEQRGVTEFSGRMIVRPHQVNDLALRGMNWGEIEARRAEARSLVSGITLNYVPETDEYIVKVPLGMNENSLAIHLMSSGDFQYVEPDWTVYPLATPNDAQYGSQWHHTRINSPTAWNHFTGDGSVIVAITDTGVRLTHQDLSSQLVPGANSATGTAIPQASGGQVNDIHGHGTHCAGIAAARGNNTVGVSGVSWNAKIMPIRVTNSSGGSSSIAALTAGARWAADNGARVVSTSYSGVSSTSVQTTGNYIKFTRNGVYCWAAGNDNVARTVDHADVTIVGASTTTDTKASFSAFGIAIDVFAPGVNIHATYNTNDSAYGLMSGTSMACPCAAGLAGLITGTNPLLTAQEVETILYQTCFDLTAAPGGVGNDGYWGWGRIDATAAVQRAYNTKPFLANALSIVFGSLTSGGVPQLAASDNQFVKLGEGVLSARVPIMAEIQSSSTNNSIARLDFVIESSSSRLGVLQTVQLFDYVANAWVQVDSRPITMTDQTFTITPSSPQRFRQPGTGQMKARVGYGEVISASGRAISVQIDRVSWTTAAS
jgi:hypothetical protein